MTQPNPLRSIMDLYGLLNDDEKQRLLRIKYLYESLGYVYEEDFTGLFFGGYNHYYSFDWLNNYQKSDRNRSLKNGFDSKCLLDELKSIKKSKYTDYNKQFVLLQPHIRDIIYALLREGKTDVLECFNEEGHEQPKMVMLVYLNAVFSAASRLLKASNSDFWGMIGQEGTMTHEESIAFHFYQYYVNLKPVVFSSDQRLTCLHRDNDEAAINATCERLESIVAALEAVTMQERYRPYYRQHFESHMLLMRDKDFEDWKYRFISLCPDSGYASCFSQLITFAFEKDSMIIPESAKNLPSKAKKSL